MAAHGGGSFKSAVLLILICGGKRSRYCSHYIELSFDTRCGKLGTAAFWVLYRKNNIFLAISGLRGEGTGRSEEVGTWHRREDVVISMP